MLTYEQQLSLVQRGLAVKKVNPENGLVTFKYHKKVMYDYMWDDHPELLECRGHTYDPNTGELVVAAPKKSFNYLENDTWKDKPLSTPVKMYKKWNGFMACVSWHNNNIVVSTTGSTTSDYVKMAEEVILGAQVSLNKNITTLFEILHPADPHIVDDLAVFGGKPTAVLLGHRDKLTGVYTPSGEFIECTLGEALEKAKKDRGEGFMLFDEGGDVCKLKTPYYSLKKKLMRMGKPQTKSLFSADKQTANKLMQKFPEHKLMVYDALQVGYELWQSWDAQRRRIYLEQCESYPY